MGSRHVFDVWVNSVGDGRLAYAASGHAPSAPYPEAWHPAKAKPAKAKPKKIKVAEEETDQAVPVTKKSKATPPAAETAPEPPPPEEEPAPEPAPENQPHPKHKWLLAGIGALSLIILGLGVFLFILRGSLSPIYLADVRIAANQKEPQLQQLINARAAKYNLAFQFTDGKISRYRLAPTGISVDARASAAQATQQITDGYLARLMWWRPIKLSLVSKTDKDLFQKFLGESVIKPSVPHKNASFVINGSQVSITPEAPGKGQTLANPYIDVPAAVAAMDNHPIKLHYGAIPAPISRGNLINQKPRLEKILAQKITLHLDRVNIAVKSGDIAGWLDMSPVEHDKTIDINVNSGKVLAYLNKAAAPYIQPPRSRLVTTEADGTMAVLDQGADGIDIVNKDQAASTISQAAVAAKGLEQRLDISHASAKTIEVRPSDKWIVVDVTAKRMYAYEQTNLVRTVLVSAGAPKTPTALGQFAIYAKYAQQDMRGNNADGSRYFQPNVKWINYFSRDYAIHGNYWRPTSWFGNINSSHGCVGMVESDAKWVYDWAPIGTPVIVHS